MKYCVKCVMPSTRPGITFDENGVCAACQSYENRKNVDYKKRWQELEALCNKYRGMNGPNGYDCMIAVSGGKDSHFQVHIIKERLNMNPLLVTVEDNLPMSKAGMHNLKNISEVFDCNIISIKPSVKAQRDVTKYTFEKYGKTTYLIDRYIYTYPLHMASKFNTPLIIYGENVSYEYGGEGSIETYSARDQIDNGVASGISKEELINNCLNENNLMFFDPPIKEELNKLEPIYLSYFIEWNSFDNYEFAKRCGFHDLTHEWTRTHHVQQFDQIDNPGDSIHDWLKFVKFGHASATDYTARMIRYGMLTREEAIKLIKKHDHDLDPRTLREFCQFMGYHERYFWKIVDKLYNRDLFIKRVVAHGN